ncbi:unnamed protein product [Lupinus luteus]|uniref:Uncharacterized protein n=1 Tax=Lupinus luteus TaxID=3873 RepID=A0AAV1Y6X6_LUPLU
MANSRLARLFMEVAPPQHVSVMRHRTSKMLDTIKEEERELNLNDSIIATLKNSSPLSSSPASASATITTLNSKYLLKEVHRSLSALNN